MVYRVFDGRCFYELITNSRFVEMNFTFAFVFTLKPSVIADTALFPSARFSIQKSALAKSKEIIS